MEAFEVVLDSLPSQPFNLAASWGLGNSLIAFPTQKQRKQEQKSTSESKINLYQISWETLLHESTFRKLVNESLHIFLNLQKLSKEDDGIPGSSLVPISRQYRSILRDCQEQMDSKVDSAQEDEKEKFREFSEILYKLELIWNLMEILFVEKNPCGTVLPQLISWVSQHFPQCEQLALNVLYGATSEDDMNNQADYLERPESHPEYWNAIFLYVLQAKCDKARKLLSVHADFNSDHFASIDELLRKMPIYSTGMSVADFEYRWRHWQSEVVTRKEEGDFANQPELAQLADILAGATEVFQGKVLDLCETWYEWMVGHLLYNNPAVKVYDLAHFAEQAISKFGGLSSISALDSVILAAMELDIPQVMNELCVTLDNHWFAAHLLDLFYHADQLQVEFNTSPDAEYQVGESLREFLLLEYATCLMTHQSLWQVGVLYFDYCPLQGRQRLELLLEKTPIHNKRRAEQVLAVAAERGMTTVTTATCKVLGMEALKSNRIGAAMVWGLKSQDVNFTTFLADQLLQMYCDHGSFTAEDLLDHLGSCMVVSDRLTFLAKYREFHRLCQSAEFKPAAVLLHSLLWSRLAPKYFWVTLFVDCVPFLTQTDPEDPIYFSSEQTFELMHCLEELSLVDDLPGKQKVLLAENEQVIRLKLSKNLARAIMQEGDNQTVF